MHHEIELVSVNKDLQKALVGQKPPQVACNATAMLIANPNGFRPLAAY